MARGSGWSLTQLELPISRYVVVLSFEHMGKAAKRLATYEDVLNAPPHKVAEIIDDELILSPRPAGPHSSAESTLMEELGPPFARGRGGPGGWIILFEPELHLGSNVLVPDLAGWRRETMSAIAKTPAYFTSVPTGSARCCRRPPSGSIAAPKSGCTPRPASSQAWLINPLQHTLEVLRLSVRDARPVDVARRFQDEASVRADPFAAIELELAALWQDVEP